jgi:hypothetical protein
VAVFAQRQKPRGVGAAMNKHAPNSPSVLCPEGTRLRNFAFFKRLCDRTFRTPGGKGFVAIDTDHGPKSVPIHSRQFRQWLGFKLEEESGERPSQAELRSAIERLEVYALDAPVADVHVRVRSRRCKEAWTIGAHN